MADETNWNAAGRLIDQVAEKIDDRTPLEVVVAVGIGYAVLAVMDEVAEVRTQLAELRDDLKTQSG
jgi:hypothetical protein